MQQIAQTQQTEKYGRGDFRYTNLQSLYDVIALAARKAGVKIVEYSATRMSFENGVFGRRISGIEMIVQREFTPVLAKR